MDGRVYLLEGPPHFEMRKGIVYITDTVGSTKFQRAMPLSDFVTTTKNANLLAREWVAEAGNVVDIRKVG